MASPNSDGSSFDDYGPEESRAMAIDNIRKRIVKYGTEHLLNALPLPKDLHWVQHSAANPTTALVIGISDGSHVLAFLTRYGDKKLEVRYCTRPVEGFPNVFAAPVKARPQHEVMDLPLIAPFKYLADQSKPMKHKFSMLIRWYFLSHGIINNIECEWDGFCKRFSQALKKIDEEERAMATEGTLVEALRKRDAVEESPDPDEAESVYGLPSTSRNGAAENTNCGASEQETPSKRTPGVKSNEANPDLRRLREYLVEHDSLHLLENIHDADGMKFFDQAFVLDAQPKKLFVGHHSKSGDDIFAYMVRLQRGFHEIRFYVERSRSRDTMRVDDIVKQHILHPFNKTYPKYPAAIDQPDRARLTLMVKWYFIAAGIATDCVLGETKAFPERLRSALEYIADRMGQSAVKPQKNLANGDASHDDDRTRQGTTSGSSYVDESDIQSTLAGDPPRTSPGRTEPKKTHVARKSAPSFQRKTTPFATPTEPAPSSRITNGPPVTKTATPEATPTPILPPRTVKRTAEDAEFAELARIVTEENKLTSQVNAIDHDLEVQEMRKEAHVEKQEKELRALVQKLESEKLAFLEQWEKETSVLNKERERIDNERRNLRKQFKRQRLSSAGEE
jgi:hypothetical protein